MLISRATVQDQSFDGLYLMDWNTRRVSFLQGSEDAIFGAWSPDGRYIAAYDGSQLRLFDTRKQGWTTLGKATGFGPLLVEEREVYFCSERVRGGAAHLASGNQ